MNVIKCENGHHYDADKYEVCPHCGSKSTAEVKHENQVKERNPKKPSIWPLGGRKKSEDVTVTTISPDSVASATVGIFDDQNTEKHQDIYSEMPFADKDTVVANGTQALPWVDEDKPSEQPIDEKSILTPPVIVEEEHKSLRDEIDNSGGKTFGYFSMGATTDSDNKAVIVSNEPVVGWLVCVQGAHFGESFNIVAGKNSIGRNSDNKIILGKDGSVSREKHALIIYEPKKRNFYLQPGDSSGLTYINDDMITETRMLNKRDIIELGNGKYIFIPLCNETFSWEDYLNKE